MIKHNTIKLNTLTIVSVAIIVALLQLSRVMFTCFCRITAAVFTQIWFYVAPTGFQCLLFICYTLLLLLFIYFVCKELVFFLVPSLYYSNKIIYISLFSHPRKLQSYSITFFIATRVDVLFKTYLNKLNRYVIIMILQTKGQSSL